MNVTGTNGKTTTVKIITALLQSKYKAIACGNIGYPLSRAVLESGKSIKVVEVSSFMLEHSKFFTPRVATITNIEQDHLIRHKTMQEYEDLKKSIFKNLTPNDYAVVNIIILKTLKYVNSFKKLLLITSPLPIASPRARGEGCSFCAF